MSRSVTEMVEWQQYRPGGLNSQGDPIKTWEDPTEVGIYAFDPGSTAEPREPGADRVIVEPTIYAPASVVFGALDRVVARGLVYEVEGVTREWRHPNGPRKGNVITLRRVEG